jgi:hypothetical protein
MIIVCIHRCWSQNYSTSSWVALWNYSFSTAAGPRLNGRLPLVFPDASLVFRISISTFCLFYMRSIFLTRFLNVRLKAAPHFLAFCCIHAPVNSARPPKTCRGCAYVKLCPAVSTWLHCNSFLAKFQQSDYFLLRNPMVLH